MRIKTPIYCVVLSTSILLADQSQAQVAPTPKPNAQGAALTATSTGTIDTANPFFKPMGNGRSCATCHQEAEGWTITPAGLAARFNATGGTDPAFKPNDGANSPRAATGTLAEKRAAYSMLLSKGLIRVGLPMPANAEFTLVRTVDPYNFASATELSLFRRPLPSANLKFASSIMWDGRETFADTAANATICIAQSRPAQCFKSIDFDLLHQANGAVRGHAEATADLSAAEQRQIVDFEMGLVVAQSVSRTAGSLNADGAQGGPARLQTQNFYFGINDVVVGDYLTGAAFNRNAFNLFGAWRNAAPAAPAAPPARGTPPGRGAPPAPPAAPAAATAQDLARASIARGEGIFNNRQFNITNVAGFSDDLRPALQRGTCTSCHNAPNAGSHSVARMFNTGTSAGNLRTPDLPLYTLRNTVTGETVDTSDPGAAMLSGKWRDIGKFKTPNLRGLAARAPFFHDGSANNLQAVVRFYDRRFRMGLNQQEIADLSAFLQAL